MAEYVLKIVIRSEEVHIHYFVIPYKRGIIFDKFININIGMLFLIPDI